MQSEGQSAFIKPQKKCFKHALNNLFVLYLFAKNEENYVNNSTCNKNLLPEILSISRLGIGSRNF